MYGLGSRFGADSPWLLLSCTLNNHNILQTDDGVGQFKNRRRRQWQAIQNAQDVPKVIKSGPRGGMLLILSGESPIAGAPISPYAQCAPPSNSTKFPRLCWHLLVSLSLVFATARSCAPNCENPKLPRAPTRCVEYSLAISTYNFFLLAVDPHPRETCQEKKEREKVAIDG
jgi:hypothetical protein